MPAKGYKKTKNVSEIVENSSVTPASLLELSRDEVHGNLGERLARLEAALEALANWPSPKLAEELEPPAKKRVTTRQLAAKKKVDKNVIGEPVITGTPAPVTTTQQHRFIAHG